MLRGVEQVVLTEYEDSNSSCGWDVRNLKSAFGSKIHLKINSGINASLTTTIDQLQQLSSLVQLAI